MCVGRHLVTRTHQHALLRVEGMLLAQQGAATYYGPVSLLTLHPFLLTSLCSHCCTDSGAAPGCSAKQAGAARTQALLCCCHSQGLPPLFTCVC